MCKHVLCKGIYGEKEKLKSLGQHSGNSMAVELALYINLLYWKLLKISQLLQKIWKDWPDWPLPIHTHVYIYLNKAKIKTVPCVKTYCLTGILLLFIVRRSFKHDSCLKHDLKMAVMPFIKYLFLVSSLHHS